MKKQLLFFFILFAFISKAQLPVVFCPPGAEWRYAFFSLGPPHSAKVKYLRDSLMSGETVKVLSYGAFYPYENIGCIYNDLLYLKQQGDTVFMKCCKTNNTWQILYNFAATAGQQWLTTVQDNGFTSTTPITHTIMVNATTTTSINGWNLKRLFVTYCYTDSVAGTINCASGSITERIGYQGSVFNGYGGVNSNSGGFLFNYYKRLSGNSDYDMLLNFVCYQDNDFSPTPFSAYNCNYDVGIEENTANKINLSVYPNPAKEMLNVELNLTPTLSKGDGAETELQITTILGELIKQSTLTTQHSQIDVSNLENGIYFLQVYEKGKLLAVKKVIKE